MSIGNNHNEFRVKSNLYNLWYILVEETYRKCGMWRSVGIPYMVKIGKWKELDKEDKKHFMDGVQRKKWDSIGNHLKNNNPYIKKKDKLAE